MAYHPRIIQMKLFIAVLVLIFSLQSLSKADDINEFEIEGISIGDSLLDYVTEDYIKANSGHWHNKEYSQIIVDIKKEDYEVVAVSYKSNDKKYLIESISGSISYGQNIAKCYEQQNEIDKVFSKIFKNSKRRKDIFEKGSYGPDAGETNSIQIVYDLSSGSAVIDCLDWDQKSKPNFKDRILISIDSMKFRRWLIKQTKNKNI